MSRGNFSDGVYEVAQKGGHHGSNKRKHRERPCPNPPAAPTGLTVTAAAREAKTHLEFSGKIKWNGVFEDEQGHKIPGGGVEIDHYEGQWGYSTTSPSITWAETEDGHPRIRRFHKKSVKGVRVIDATIISGTTAEFTTKKAHGFVADEVVRVQDVKPSAYNGKWTVLASGLTTTKFRADIGAAPAALENEGTVEGQPDPNYDFIVEHLSRPRQWYVTARIRAWDNKNCPSDWTSWTTPLNVWTGADPTPPTPSNVDVDWDKGDKAGRFSRWDAIVEWDEVVNFDYPGTPADDEEDVSRYALQFQSSLDGGTTVLRTRKFEKEAKDEDGDTRVEKAIKAIDSKKWYRARVRTIDRYNRRGTWSSWTTWEKPGQDVPSTPLNVSIHEGTKDGVVLKWDPPLESSNENVIDEELEHFQAQIATSSAFGPSVIYAWDKRITSSQKRFHIKLEDQDAAYYGRVRSVSFDGIPSAWIPATRLGNSNVGASPDGVNLLRDKVRVDFTVSGDVEAKHYDTLWPADRRYKFKRVRVRFGRHDSSTHPADGCPQGQAAVVQVFWHDEDETTQDKLFSNDSRLTVQPSTHRDSVWADDITRTHIEENEHLSVKVTQVGTTAPGSDMVVSVIMVPD